MSDPLGEQPLDERPVEVPEEWHDDWYDEENAGDVLDDVGYHEYDDPDVDWDELDWED